MTTTPNWAQTRTAEIFAQLLDEQHSVSEAEVVERFMASLSPAERAELAAAEAALN